MIDYVKQETNIYKNCYKSCALIFGQSSKQMCLKLEYHEYYQNTRG